MTTAGWVVIAVLGLIIVLGVGLWLTNTRKPKTLATNARALARRHARDARDEARRKREVAEAEAVRGVAKVDAEAKKKVDHEVSSGLVGHLRRLSRDSDCDGD